MACITTLERYLPLYNIILNSSCSHSSRKNSQQQHTVIATAVCILKGNGKKKTMEAMATLHSLFNNGRTLSFEASLLFQQLHIHEEGYKLVAGNLVLGILAAGAYN